MISEFFPIRLTELWFIENGITTIYWDKDLSLSNYTLNSIGSYIWKHCDGELSNIEITNLLYGGLEGEKPSYESLKDEVADFFNDLKSQELLTWQESILLDVLLINSPFPKIYSAKAIDTPEFSAPPLGIAYIAEVLRQNNYSVSIFDMHIELAPLESIITKLDSVKPKIIGISSTTPTFPNSLKIAKLIKAWDKNITIIIGGAHATCSTQECLEKNVFDYVVLGEGEDTMLELSDLIIKGEGNIAEIKGIAYKNAAGEIIFNKPRKRPVDLDVIPFPARDLLKLESYFKSGAIISSRGCPYKCNYCACAAIVGNTYRPHSVDYTIKEIEFLIQEYGFTNFDFHDDTFNLHPARVFEFCEKIIERQLNIKWGCFCRATKFNYKLAKAMADAGCEVVQFGVESGNQEILNSINKKITLQEVEDAVEAASKAGIKQIACGLIIGHPEDTEETIFDTIKFGIKLKEIGATRISLSVLTPFPGTEVYDKRDELGIKILTKDWEQFIFSRIVMETKNLSREKLREIFTKGVFSFIEAPIKK